MRFAHSRCRAPRKLGVNQGKTVQAQESQLGLGFCRRFTRSTQYGLPASDLFNDRGGINEIGTNGAAAPRCARGSREGRFMKRFGTAFAVALVALCVTAGCNDYGNTFQANTGAGLLSLSPSNVTAGGPDMTLTVMGNGFVAKTVVQWNGKTIATTVTTDSNTGAVLSVTAVVPAALTATPGRAFVNTLNPKTSNQNNGLSQTVAFIINVPANPVPQISDISPKI